VDSEVQFLSTNIEEIGTDLDDTLPKDATSLTKYRLSVTTFELLLCNVLPMLALVKST